MHGSTAHAEDQVDRWVCKNGMYARTDVPGLLAACSSVSAGAALLDGGARELRASCWMSVWGGRVGHLVAKTNASWLEQCWLAMLAWSYIDAS